jgi:uncharacterized caspase-like protein
MRRGLIVGIDDYPHNPLRGCVADAEAIAELLTRNADGSPNFTCKLLVSSAERVLQATLRKQITQLFAKEADMVVLFFAGHGGLVNDQGWLLTQDASKYDLGMGMAEVTNCVNNSKAREVLIILDCCHSGALAQRAHMSFEMVSLRKGVSILAATERSQEAKEANGRGLFTCLVCDALSGGAADILGRVTVPDVYAYVELLLGPWDQRPTFKSHVSRLATIRNCSSQIDVSLLRSLPELFPSPDYEFPLDPSYEPDAEPDDEEHEKIFSQFQKLRASRLLVPIGAEHMYYAAMEDKACALTPLGQYYWRLAENGQL